MPLTLEIVTPAARVYSDTIDSVVIPSTDGEVGILPGHVPLLTQVDHGELRVIKDGRALNLAVGGGFAQVSSDRKFPSWPIFAIEEEKIDEHAAEEAMKRAQDDLKGANLDLPPKSSVSKASSVSPWPSWAARAAGANRPDGGTRAPPISARESGPATCRSGRRLTRRLRAHRAGVCAGRAGDTSA